MNFTIILPLISAILAISIGIFVFKQNRKSLINQTFFLFTLGITEWFICTFMMFLYKDDVAGVIFWDRLVYAGVAFMPVFTYKFYLALIGKKSDKILYVGYLLSISFAILTRSKYFIDGIYVYSWGVHTQARILHHIFLVYFVVFILLWFFATLKFYKSLKPSLIKEQTKYIFISFGVFYLIAPLGFLAAYNVGVYPVTYFSGLIFTIMMAYCIAIYRVMDIKLVIRKSSVYLFSLATVLIFMTTVKLISAQLFTAPPIWIDLLVLLIAVYIFSPIKHYYYRLANKYFFSSLYDSRELIADLSDKLRSTIEIGKIYEYVSEILVNALHVTAFGVVSFDEKKQVYITQYGQGLNIGQQEIFPGSKEIYKIFTKRNQPIIVEEIKFSNFKINKSILNLLTKANVALLSPLNMKDKTVGMMVFGPKESKDPFNEEDLKVLEILGTQIAFAMENALLYAESVKFNIQLNEEKNKIAAIIANFIDPIIFVDRYNNINLINPAAKNILGLTEKSLGVSIDTSNNCPMSNFRTVIKKEFQIKEIGNLKSTDHHSEEMSILVNNQELIYKITTIRVFDDQTNHLGLMKIFVNLTREKGIDKMKSEFISIAAHQLRTPLSAIKWVIKMILDGDAGELNVEQKDLLRKGYISNERIIRLVNDLLNVSRIEEGKFGFNFEKTDFQEILTTTKSNLEGLIAKNHQELIVQKPEKLPKVYLDKERMVMVLQNLLDNAIKYTPEYGKIEIIVTTDKKFLHVKVKDQGVGISKNDQAKLFSKFFRASNALKLETEGSGLGLFIVKNIIEKHNGSIELKSEEGRGTEISFSLPIEQKL